MPWLRLSSGPAKGFTVGVGDGEPFSTVPGSRLEVPLPLPPGSTPLTLARLRSNDHEWWLEVSHPELIRVNNATGLHLALSEGCAIEVPQAGVGWQFLLRPPTSLLIQTGAPPALPTVRLEPGPEVEPPRVQSEGLSDTSPSEATTSPHLDRISAGEQTTQVVGPPSPLTTRPAQTHDLAESTWLESSKTPSPERDPNLKAAPPLHGQPSSTESAGSTETPVSWPSYSARALLVYAGLCVGLAGVLSSILTLLGAASLGWIHGPSHSSGPENALMPAPVLEPPQLRIESDPPGLSIRVNGEYKAPTPLTLRLSPGLPILVQIGQDEKASIPLPPLQPGSLNVIHWREDGPQDGPQDGPAKKAGENSSAATGASDREARSSSGGRKGITQRTSKPNSVQSTVDQVALDVRTAPPDSKPPQTNTLDDALVRAEINAPNFLPIKLDGKNIGTTPLEKRIPVGKHTFEYPDEEGIPQKFTFTVPPEGLRMRIDSKNKVVVANGERLPMRKIP